MKRIFISAAVCALLATSCQNEELVSSQESNFFRLEVEKGNGSRTAIANDGSVTWSEGDKLFVYGDNGAYGTLSLDKEDVGTSNGTFTGYVYGKIKDLKYVAYGNGVQKSGNDVKVTLSDITLPNSNAPMFATLDPNNLNSVTLQHVCGVVRMNIVGLQEGDIVSVVGKGIAGSATFNEEAVELVADDTAVEQTIKVTGAKDSYHIDVPLLGRGTVEKVYVNNMECDITDFVVTAGKLDASSIPTLNLKDGELVKTEDAVNTLDAIKSAVSSSGAVVTVAAGKYGAFRDIKPEGNVTIICEEGTVFKGWSKFNMNGATIVGATFTCDWENDSYTVADQTINGVFKNCVFDSWHVMTPCYAGDKVEFEDCVFKGGSYCVHFDGGENDITFRRCTLSGFNAFGAKVTMLTFEDCKFIHDTTGLWDSKYNGVNLWGSAKMIGCEFTFDGSTENEWIDCIGAGQTYEFENCTMNGKSYTPDNYVNYIEKIYSKNHVKVKINGVDCQL